ncbi:LysR family transcriptional regulator substrate-binding protein [Corynebacterium sp. A21]|uniref:LysR family transcriptional regulator substrate-binding protein n=1 Tax=Corynebacterium sp. A21 TaxID=3457318 RepID=UPI003FD2CE09
MLTLSFVTGTEPGKWFERFQERTRHGRLEAWESEDPLAALIDASAQLALVRLPDHRLDPEQFHVVELYQEEYGVALPRDSELTLITGPVSAEDIAGEIINYQVPDNGEVDVVAVRDALQIVAANVGVVIAPKPLIKVLSKKLVVPRTYSADGIPQTQIALAWRQEGDSDAIQDFVGIAKGRTLNSSRQIAPRLSAREKALAKQARRAAEKPAARSNNKGGFKGGAKRGNAPRRHKGR